MHVTTRRFHAREIERRTKVRALEGQAQLLLNDLNEYSAWLEHTRGRPVPPEQAADLWLHDVYQPTFARIAGAVGPERDLVQAYSDVLEQKWYLSEAAGRDVGLDQAIQAYVALGAGAGDARGRCGERIGRARPRTAGRGRRPRWCRSARRRRPNWTVSVSGCRGTITP
jgi:hypothetical protein